MKYQVTLFLAVGTLALAGCNTPNHIEGSLAVSAPLNVVTSSNKKVTVAPATYQTSLALQSERAEVRIHTASGRVIFVVPQVKADAYGNINIPAAKLGQEFALQGKIGSERYDIDRVRGASCVHHYDQEYKCRDEQHCVKDNQGHETCGTEHVCGFEQVPVYGTEDVHETGYQDSKVVTINLVKAARAVGRFSGSYTYGEHISSSEVVSGCRL